MKIFSKGTKDFEKHSGIFESLISQTKPMVIKFNIQLAIFDLVILYQ